MVKRVGDGRKGSSRSFLPSRLDVMGRNCVFHGVDDQWGFTSIGVMIGSGQVIWEEVKNLDGSGHVFLYCAVLVYRLSLGTCALMVGVLVQSEGWWNMFRSLESTDPYIRRDIYRHSSVYTVWRCLWCVSVIT
jgi:hypothetical protein